MTTESHGPPKVVTVALNPALDCTIELQSISLGTVNRADKMRADAGGKGINVASCLADFGVATAITGLLGRENSAIFETLLREKSIDNHFCYLDGSNRTNTKLIDLKNHQTTDINLPGPQLSAPEIENLLARIIDRIEALLPAASWVVLAGSLPPGWPSDTYSRIIERVHARDSLVALDASGAALGQGLSGGPDLIKPNLRELSELTGNKLTNPESILAAGSALFDGHPSLSTVIVSLGEKGAIFLSRLEGIATLPKKIPLISSVGAGDAMVAGAIAGMLANLSLKKLAQLATAFSAVKLTRLGPHLSSPDEVRRMATTIETRKIVLAPHH